MSEFLGCGDSSCKLERPDGMMTNGGCMCLKALSFKDRVRVEKFLLRQQNRIKDLEADAQHDKICKEEGQQRIKELEAELQRYEQADYME